MISDTLAHKKTAFRLTMFLVPATVDLEQHNEAVAAPWLVGVVVVQGKGKVPEKSFASRVECGLLIGPSSRTASRAGIFT